MADAGNTWLVRRAERLYADQLGRLRHTELSWRIRWNWLPALVLVGFVYGTIFQFTGRPSSSGDPELFSNIPLFITVSVLTGLVLWSLTLFWSFRRVLVFDRGLLYAYAQKHTARAIYWRDVDPASLRTVESPAGTNAGSLLKTLERKDKTPLGVHGRYALVFHGLDTPLNGDSRAAGLTARFFTFSMDRSPEKLVDALQGAMAAGLVRPGSAPPRAFPPLPISSEIRLDQP